MRSRPLAERGNVAARTDETHQVFLQPSSLANSGPTDRPCGCTSEGVRGFWRRNCPPSPSGMIETHTGSSCSVMQIGHSAENVAPISCRQNMSDMICGEQEGHWRNSNRAQHGDQRQKLQERVRLEINAS